MPNEDGAGAGDGALPSVYFVRIGCGKCLRRCVSASEPFSAGSAAWDMVEFCAPDFRPARRLTRPLSMPSSGRQTEVRTRRASRAMVIPLARSATKCWLLSDVPIFRHSTGSATTSAPVDFVAAPRQAMTLPSARRLATVALVVAEGDMDRGRVNHHKARVAGRRQGDHRTAS
jgi:hypothetical protein